MKLTYFEKGFFPFCVPQMGASFASNTGSQTVYPAGFSLDQVLQIYWRAKDYQLVASGGGTLGEVSQTLSINGPLPPRNTTVDTSLYGGLAGFAPTGPGDLVCGRGLRQIVPGTGTITASGPALFNLQVNLFFPEVFAPNPLVQFNGLWWPALSVSCQVTNTVTLTSGGQEQLEYDCSTLPDPNSTTPLGTFTFFGVDVPVFCTALAPPSGPDAGETRSFAGTLSVSDEWS